MELAVSAPLPVTLNTLLNLSGRSKWNLPASSCVSPVTARLAPSVTLPWISSVSYPIPLGSVKSALIATFPSPARSLITVRLASVSKSFDPVPTVSVPSTVSVSVDTVPVM